MRISYENKLRQFREAAALTQIELVVKSGVGLSTVNKLENHPLETGLEVGQRLATALGYRVDEIFPYLVICGECGHYADARTQAGMKCGRCACGMS